MGLKIESIQTQNIGYAPILRHYFERCKVTEVIDNNVPLDPRRKVLSHGQACVAMITGILYQMMQLYNLEKLAEDTNVLEVILPGIMIQECSTKTDSYRI